MYVLVVDDSAPNRVVINAMLSEAGVQVSEAEDGLTALAAIAAERFDLILLDLRMPGVDGLTVLDELRRKLGDAMPPVVIVTADSAADLRQRCLDAGARGFLNKPVLMDHLFDIVAQIASAQGLSV